jgi:hypothetical protein
MRSVATRAASLASATAFRARTAAPRALPLPPLARAAVLLLAAASSSVASSSSSVALTSGADQKTGETVDCGCGTEPSQSQSPSPSRDALISLASAAQMASSKPSLAQFKGEVVTDIRTGEKKTMGDLYSDKPAVLAFLRRLG